ncbi:response regulator [uncultured Methylophaga sp.]|uniref:response regulator n=1 Tax=uncultured Methylophaga sp. TaxID=285271 RepID=UPI002614425E|nr:response regulator [uncultured Methylophaga sp.]
MQTKTALVVDDSRVARLTLGKLLKSHQFEVVEQGSAEEAMSWLQQTPTQPDIVFMDVMMGGMDGLAATRQLKADPNLAALPVIICTGKDTDADLEQALASGASAVLPKPPAADALQQLLDDIAQTASEAAPDATASSAQSEVELLAAVRAALLPEIENKLAASLSALQQQIDQQKSAQQSSGGLDALQEIGEKLSGSVQSQLEEFKHSLSSQADDLVSGPAAQAVDKAVDQLGLRDKLETLFENEGRQWLNQQQAAVREALQQQLMQDMNAVIEQKLGDFQARLANQQETEQQQLLAEQQQQHEAIKSQLVLQRNLSFGAAGLAVLALIVALV